MAGSVMPSPKLRCSSAPPRVTKRYSAPLHRVDRYLRRIRGWPTQTDSVTYAAFLDVMVENYESVAWAEELIGSARAADHPRLAALYMVASQCYMGNRRNTPRATSHGTKALTISTAEQNETVGPPPKQDDERL